MSPKLIRVSGKIAHVRLKEDFSVPDEVFLEEEEEIDPEEAARLEAERLERERFEQRVKEEVDSQVREKLDMQYKVLKEKYEREREEAYNAGLEEGHNKGVLEERARLEPIKDNLIKISDKIAEHQTSIIRDAEGVVVRLAFRMAKKVIGDELETSPETITKIVRDALKFIVDETSFAIRINPEDYAVIEKHVNELATQSDDVRDIRIIPDAKIARGGCIIESQTGIIDARLEAKLGLLENLVQKTERNSGREQSGS